MADNAKKSTDDAVEQKGWAEKTEKVNTAAEDKKDTSADEEKDEDQSNSGEESTVKTICAKPEEPEETSDDAPEGTDASSKDDDAEDEGGKANVEINIELPEEMKSGKKVENADFQEAVREQIENCKFEIIAAVQENVHAELKDFFSKQLRKAERRRRLGVVVRDILILLLAAVVGYFGYCLYDAKYFSFMKTDCERNGTCEQVSEKVVTPAKPEVVKDTAWYQNNYGYLLDSLKTNLNADKVSAYYLYSGDYKISEIKPNYLLAMAYNRLNSNITYDSDKGIIIPANDLRNSFVNLFGNADHFVKQNFTYDCAEFTYDRESDSFITPSVQCNSTSDRQILEEVDEIYEEGNVMYFITTAAIYDKVEESFYTFDNLFKPAVKSVLNNELTKHKDRLNQYQYSFKKVNNQYYFSDIVKLK